MVTKMRYRNLFLILVCCVTVSIPVISGRLRRSAQKSAQDDFNGLLAGDDRVSISSLVFKGQKRIVIDQPEITTCLTTAFRSARLGDCKLGIAWDVEVTLSNGSTVPCSIYFPEDTDEITVSAADADDVWNDPLPLYRVKLPSPILKQLREVLCSLR
jgi:hypothetical protein